MRKTLKYQIVGESPLLMHNGQMSNPFNPIVRQLKPLTAKRQKTDEDLMQIAELEWHGGLYLKDGKPCIPGEAIEATLRNAAKKTKQGKLTKLAIDCPDDAMLEYDGPKDPKKLWENEEFRFWVRVKVKQNTVYRMRPIFKKWKATIGVRYDDEMLNEADVKRFVTVAGREVGFLDWRPKFGRYEVAPQG